MKLSAEPASAVDVNLVARHRSVVSGRQRMSGWFRPPVRTLSLMVRWPWRRVQAGAVAIAIPLPVVMAVMVMLAVAGLLPGPGGVEMAAVAGAEMDHHAGALVVVLSPIGQGCGCEQGPSQSQSEQLRVTCLHGVLLLVCDASLPGSG